MATPSLLRPSLAQNSYICARCAFRASKITPKTSRRWIGLKYLTKVAEAEIQWQEKAKTIRSGTRKSMLTILEERGLVQSTVGPRDELDKKMTENRIGAYVGIDPTASSLHVGHMLPLMSIFWMYLHGFHAVSLLGGATAKVGDPTGRLTSREQTESSVRTANMVSMHYQMKQLWNNAEEMGKKWGYEREWSWHRELVNNNAWWNKLPMLEVLQTLGPGMRMGPMLARETVKRKMTGGDGMSWAEFTYPLMQAWDWWHMYLTKGVSLQIGGADQYGNITAGATAVRYISKNHSDPDVQKRVSMMPDPTGFTVPLLTTASGEKFGKSAGNAVFLDRQQTSVFDLYGFFLRTPDADVEKYLKMFTFMPVEQIRTLVDEHTENPSQRKAQHTLAQEFVGLIHGQHEAKLAESQHRLLFRKTPLTEEEKAELEALRIDPDAKGDQVTINNKPSPNIKLPHSLIHNKSLPKIIYAAGLADSNSDATRLIQGGAIYIGGQPDGKRLPMLDGMVSWTKCSQWLVEDTAKHIVHGDLLMFRRGKHNIRIVQIVSDEKYGSSGQTHPAKDAVNYQPQGGQAAKRTAQEKGKEQDSGDIDAWIDNVKAKEEERLRQERDAGKFRKIVKEFKDVEVPVSEGSVIRKVGG